MSETVQESYYSQVPGELTSLPNWVQWKLVTRDGKPTKIPFTIDGSMASSIDHSSWTRFDAVCHIPPQKTSGIGFVFDGSGIVGIDIDHCLKADGSVDEKFSGVLNSLKTFTEISPGGGGLHLFLRCNDAPYERGRKKGDIEIYSSSRYFTVTGRMWPNSVPEIREYPAETIRKVCDPFFEPEQRPKAHSNLTSFSQQLTDDEIISKMRKARNGDAFWRLYEGDINGYPSASEADMALAGMISFYTKDALQIIRLMKESGLLREKWDQHPTYLTGTVATAISKCSGSYSAQAPAAAKKKSGARRREETEIPEYILQQRGWFERDRQLYLEVIDTSDDTPTYCYATSQNGSVSFVDEVMVKEPVRDNDEIALSGLKYVPRALPLNKDGQVVHIVCLPDKSDLDHMKTSDAHEIRHEIYRHVNKYCDLPHNDVDLCVYYIFMSWFYPKLSTLPYLRFRADTGKGKSRILKVVSELCFMPVKAGGSSTAAGTIRIQEHWHGTLVIDEADIKGEADSEGYSNDTIKFLNLGFERGQYFVKSDKVDPKKQEIFDPFSPKIIAMRGIFQDPATEGRCLSISPSETERKDIPAILPTEYNIEVRKIRAMLAHYVLTHWGCITDSDPYPAFNDVDCEPRLKQLGSPLARVLSKVFPDGLEEFKHYIERRQVEIKVDRAGSFFGCVVNAAYDRALDPENLANVVTLRDIADTVGSTSQKVSRILKDIGMTVEARLCKITVSIPNQEPREKRITQKIAVVKDARVWREICRRYITPRTEQAQISNNDLVDCPTALKSKEYVAN